MNYIRFFPFHVWQAYYDAHQKPPVWGERPHFTDGIIDYYAELLGINRGHRLLNSCAFQRGKTTLKVMKNAHAALARGLEIVTGNCLTGSVRKLHGNLWQKIWRPFFRMPIKGSITPVI